MTKSVRNQLSALLVAYFVSVGANKSLGETVKQLAAGSSRWIAPKNDQNMIVSQRQLFGSAARIINMLNGIMHSSEVNRSSLVLSNQYNLQSPSEMIWNLKNGQKWQPLTELDTGGSTFDRFIVSERRNDNPFLDWITSKFYRRGLDWSSGNLRLVNMHGNSILGSDMIIHDSSIEIPLKQWLYILNSILKPNFIYT